MENTSFIQKIKTDPVLKAKVIKAGIFFLLFIVIVIAVAFSQSKDKTAIDGDKQNQINGRIIPADTSSIGSSKDEFYMMKHQDSANQIATNSETVLGGSVTEKQASQDQTDAALNQYMANRQQSVNRMQNSSTENTYVPPKRRNYNPNGNANDWTSEKTSVSSNTYTSKGNDVIGYTRNYNPENPSSSTVTQNNEQTAAQITPNRALTKEEKLQQAIANKYNNTSSSNNGPISVVAAIYNDQKIKANNTSVRLILKDKLYFNNTTIGTDAFIYGSATISGDKILISVPSISYKGKNYNVNLNVYDYRTGEKGIPIHNDNIVGTVEREAENQVNQQAGKYGRIGSVITSVLNGRNKNAYIFLSDGHKIYLKSN